jgi:hypothetical protein
MLPPGTSFNASGLIDENSVPLLDNFFPAGWSVRQRKLVLHIDNAPAHNAKMTRDSFEHNPLKKFQHPLTPPLSSIRPLYIRKVKGALVGREIPDEINLLEAVIEILNDSNAELQRVFRCWIARVQKVIDAEGDYLSESIV